MVLRMNRLITNLYRNGFLVPGEFVMSHKVPGLPQFYIPLEPELILIYHD